MRKIERVEHSDGGAERGRGTFPPSWGPAPLDESEEVRSAWIMKKIHENVIPSRYKQLGRHDIKLAHAMRLARLGPRDPS